jgi:hypothetical protein
MVYFQTKNSNLGEFSRALYWTMLVYFTAMWYILLPFGIFNDHLVYFPILVRCTKENLATLMRHQSLSDFLEW